MRTIPTSLAALVLVAASAASSSAAPGDPVDEIAECMAYYAVESGVDGDSPIDPGIMAVLKDLGGNLFVEGPRLGLTDDDLLMRVAAALEAMNLRSRMDGLDAIRSRYGDRCDDLISSIRGIT